MRYIRIDNKWQEEAEKALTEGDAQTALRLIGEVISPPELGLRLVGTCDVTACRDCRFYVKDPDPNDPGWPMMCEETGRDMVEPYGGCVWGEPR